MAGKKDDTDQITSMRDVKFSREEKHKLMIMGVVILVVLAIAIYITTAFVSLSSNLAYLPNNCGNQSTQAGLNSCITNYANITTNATVCFYLQGSQRSSCVAGVAEKSQNVSMCGILGSSNQYYPQCILVLNTKLKSMTLCGYLPSEYALPCIYNISAAYNFSNQNLCASLSNRSYSNECIDLLYYRNAVGSHNLGYCSYLQNKQNATTLFFMNYNNSQNYVSAVTNSILFSTLNITPKGYCQLRLAVLEKNQSICSEVGGSFANECSSYVEAAVESSLYVDLNATNVTDACGAYSGSNASVCRFNYLLANAIAGNSIAPCHMLNGSSTQDLCVYQFAVSERNLSYCPSITNYTVQSLCSVVINGLKKS